MELFMGGAACVVHTMAIQQTTHWRGEGAQGNAGGRWRGTSRIYTQIPEVRSGSRITNNQQLINVHQHSLLNKCTKKVQILAFLTDHSPGSLVTASKMERKVKELHLGTTSEIWIQNAKHSDVHKHLCMKVAQSDSKFRLTDRPQSCRFSHSLHAIHIAWVPHQPPSSTYHHLSTTRSVHSVAFLSSPLDLSASRLSSHN